LEPSPPEPGSTAKAGADDEVVTIGADATVEALKKRQRAVARRVRVEALTSS